MRSIFTYVFCIASVTLSACGSNLSRTRSDSALASGQVDLWLDVTKSDDGKPSNCKDNAFRKNCSFKDLKTNKEFSREPSNKMIWQAAIEYCEKLKHNGHSDWRLPSKDELMTASAHGIYPRTVDLLLSEGYAAPHWSSDTLTGDDSPTSHDIYRAWAVALVLGRASDFDKDTGAAKVTCIRP